MSAKAHLDPPVRAPPKPTSRIEDQMRAAPHHIRTNQNLHLVPALDKRGQVLSGTFIRPNGIPQSGVLVTGLPPEAEVRNVTGPSPSSSRTPSTSFQMHPSSERPRARAARRQTSTMSPAGPSTAVTPILPISATPANNNSLTEKNGETDAAEKFNECVRSANVTFGNLSSTDSPAPSGLRVLTDSEKVLLESAKIERPLATWGKDVVDYTQRPLFRDDLQAPRMDANGEEELEVDVVMTDAMCENGEPKPNQGDSSQHKTPNRRCKQAGQQESNDAKDETNPLDESKPDRALLDSIIKVNGENSSGKKKLQKTRMSEADRLMCMDFGPKEGGRLEEVQWSSERRRRPAHSRESAESSTRKVQPQRAASAVVKKKSEDYEDDEQMEDEDEEYRPPVDDTPTTSESLSHHALRKKGAKQPIEVTPKSRHSARISGTPTRRSSRLDSSTPVPSSRDSATRSSATRTPAAETAPTKTATCQKSTAKTSPVKKADSKTPAAEEALSTSAAQTPEAEPLVESPAEKVLEKSPAKQVPSKQAVQTPVTQPPVTESPIAQSSVKKEIIKTELSQPPTPSAKFVKTTDDPTCKPSVLTIRIARPNSSPRPNKSRMTGKPPTMKAIVQLPPELDDDEEEDVVEVEKEEPVEKIRVSPQQYLKLPPSEARGRIVECKVFNLPPPEKKVIVPLNIQCSSLASSSSTSSNTAEPPQKQPSLSPALVDSGPAPLPMEVDTEPDDEGPGSPPQLQAEAPMEEMEEQRAQHVLPNQYAMSQTQPTVQSGPKNQQDLRAARQALATAFSQKTRKQRSPMVNPTFAPRQDADPPVLTLEEGARRPSANAEKVATEQKVAAPAEQSDSRRREPARPWHIHVGLPATETVGNLLKRMPPQEHSNSPSQNLIAALEQANTAGWSGQKGQVVQAVCRAPPGHQSGSFGDQLASSSSTPNSRPVNRMPVRRANVPTPPTHHIMVQPLPHGALQPGRLPIAPRAANVRPGFNQQNPPRGGGVVRRQAPPKKTMTPIQDIIQNGYKLQLNPVPPVVAAPPGDQPRLGDFIEAFDRATLQRTYPGLLSGFDDEGPARKKAKEEPKRPSSVVTEKAKNSAPEQASNSASTSGEPSGPVQPREHSNSLERVNTPAAASAPPPQRRPSAVAEAPDAIQAARVREVPAPVVVPVEQQVPANPPAERREVAAAAAAAPHPADPIAAQPRATAEGAPVRPVLHVMEGGTVVVPPGRSLDYTTWTSDDVAEWAATFLNPNNSAATLTKIREDDVDGMVLKQMVYFPHMRGEMNIINGHYFRIVMNGKALDNALKEHTYQQALREYNERLEERNN